MLCRGHIQVDCAHERTFSSCDYSRWPVGTKEQYIAHHFRWTADLVTRLKAKMEKGTSFNGKYRASLDAVVERLKLSGAWYGKGAACWDVTDPQYRIREIGAFHYAPVVVKPPAPCLPCDGCLDDQTAVGEATSMAVSTIWKWPENNSSGVADARQGNTKARGRATRTRAARYH